MPKTNDYIKKFVDGIKMLSISRSQLKVIAKIRGIKGYKSISKDRLLSALNASEYIMIQ